MTEALALHQEQPTTVTVLKKKKRIIIFAQGVNRSDYNQDRQGWNSSSESHAVCKQPFNSLAVLTGVLALTYSTTLHRKNRPSCFSGFLVWFSAFQELSLEGDRRDSELCSLEQNA